jgi:DNA helicase-2/ATP-dependent DNA helicase PcrA
LNYDPEQLLVLAFNVKACIEVRKRLKELGGVQLSRVKVRTYHSMALDILRTIHEKIGLPRHFEIGSFESSSLFLCKEFKKTSPELFSEMEGLHGRAAKTPRPSLNTDFDSILKQIALLKNSEPDLFFENNPPELQPKFRKKALVSLSRFITESNRKQLKVSFDDLLVIAVEHLTANDGLQSWSRGRFSAIFVDEFQDINAVQLSLVQFHLNDDTALTVVGDDDQCIYEWRGAIPSHLIHFDDDFPQSKSYQLGWNYRSSENIVQASLAVIRNVSDRLEKDLSAQNLEGEAIDIRQFDSIADEHEFLLQEVITLTQSGVPGKEIAILCRTNGYLTGLSGFLQANGLHIQGDSAIQGIVAKRLLALLQCIHHGLGHPAFMDAISLGKRRLKPRDAKKLFPDNLPNPSQMEIELIELIKSNSLGDLTNTKTGTELEQFINNMNSLRAEKHDLTPLELLFKCGELFIDRDLKEYLYVDTDEKRRITDPYFIFVQIADTSPDLETMIQSIEELRSDMSAEFGDKLNVMTIHRSKGLEFDHVFIPNIRDDTFPNLKAAHDLDSDYRLYYVALSRARERLYLSGHVDANDEGIAAFLKVIPPSLRKLQKG